MTNHAINTEVVILSEEINNLTILPTSILVHRDLLPSEPAVFMANFPHSNHEIFPQEAKSQMLHVPQGLSPTGIAFSCTASSPWYPHWSIIDLLQAVLWFNDQALRYAYTSNREYIYTYHWWADRCSIPLVVLIHFISNIHIKSAYCAAGIWLLFPTRMH